MLMHFAIVASKLSFDSLVCFFDILKNIVVVDVDIYKKNMNDNIEIKMKFECRIKR